jgi:hypothetical protein
VSRDFKKVVRPGMIDIGQRIRCSYFLEIRYEDGRLSIQGVEGPNSHGGCRGSCGQSRDSLKGSIDFAPGWTQEMADRLAAVWERWHLNDLTAGSPAQEAFLRANPVVAVYPESRYTKACEMLANAGLNPDPDFYGKDSMPYLYGTEWLYEEVPTDVLDFLESLPVTDKEYPWRFA